MKKCECQKGKDGICFVERAKENLRGYTLIEGFPGMGLVGTISAKYLTEQVKFTEIGHIECDFFTPVIRVHHGLPMYPSRIYVSKEHKLVVLLSEQIIPSTLVNNLSKETIKWINQKGITRVISLAGIKTEGEGNAETVYGIAANEESLKELKKYDIEIIDEGLTTGVTAMMLLEMRKQHKFKAYSLLGSANTAADYMASAELLKKLNIILGLKITVKPLMQEAKKTQEMVLKHLNDLKKTEENTEEFEKGPQMYT
ncbi:MAG: PAC2 family protein [archaeon]